MTDEEKARAVEHALAPGRVCPRCGAFQAFPDGYPESALADCYTVVDEYGIKKFHTWRTVGNGLFFSVPHD